LFYLVGSFKSSGRSTEPLGVGSSVYTPHGVHLLIAGPWAVCWDLDPCVHMPSVIQDMVRVITLQPVQQRA